MPPPPEQSAGLVTSDPKCPLLGWASGTTMMPFRIPFILALAWNGGPALYLTYFPFLPTCFHSSLLSPSLHCPHPRGAPPPLPAGSPPPLFPRVPSASTQRARWCIVSPAPAARRALLGQALGQGGAGGGGCQGAPWGSGRGQHLSPRHWGHITWAE